MKWKWIGKGFLLMTFVSTGAEAQSILLYSDLGARNVAMAGANMSEYHDITSMYENPAAIAFLKTPSVVFNHAQGNYSEMQEDLATSVLYDNSQMLGLGMEYYSIGELNRASLYQGYRLYEMGYALAYARKLTSTFSLGGSVTFQHGVVDNSNEVNAASYALGAEYAPGGEVSYGLTLSGLGTGVDYTAANYVVASLQEILPRRLDVGATMHFPSASSLQNPFLTFALASEKVFGTSGIYYRGGIEYLPLEFLALRFGYIAGPSLSEPRYGVGLRLPPFSADIGFYWVRVDGVPVSFQQLSLSMEFQF